MLLRTPHIIFLLLLWSILYIASHEADQDGGIKNLSPASLHQHMFAHKDNLFCVLIKDTDNNSKDLELGIIHQYPIFQKTFLGAITNSSELSKVTKVSSNLQLPILRCFFACPLHEDYLGPLNHTLVSKWVKSKVRKLKQLLSKDVRSIEKTIVANEATIMSVPFLEQVVNMENILLQVKSRLNNHCSLSTIIVHPNSKHQRDIVRHFTVPQRSSMVVFIKKDRNSDPKKIIFSGQNIQSVMINSHILSEVTPVKHLTVKNFKYEALTVKTTEQFQPYIVGFYAWWAKHAESFLACFKAAVDGFREHSVSTKFALVNVAEQKSVIPAFIEQKVWKPLPFIAVFQREKGKYSVNQTILTVSHPTMFYLYQSLHSIGLQLEDAWHNAWEYYPYETLGFKQYSDMREGPFGTICTQWAHNQTDSHYIPLPKPLKPVPEMKTKIKTIEDLLPKYNGVPVMRESFWDSSVKKSDSNFGLFTSKSRVVVTVFAFIRSGCSSCETKMEVFKELYREIGKRENSRFLLVNCSYDISLCNELSVNGYPSVVAFRDFSILVTPKCDIPFSDKPYVRREYHGPIDTWQLMKWYDQLMKSSTELLKFQDPLPFSKSKRNVLLIATLIPKTSVYLPIAPNRDRNYFYSVSCFRLACELLYGLAACQLVYSKNIPASDFQENNVMVISEVDFVRKDGISMKLMSLGKPLQSLLEKETSSHLDLFHHPHQYSLSSTQTCESNHDVCTQIIVNFTRDHLRLPVTSLTSEIFHTKNNPLFDSNKPVLIVLGLPDTITATSTFMQMMYRVASSFYKDVLVTVMNVEEYPAWAGSFVPKNYNKYYIAEDDSGPLHRYPRLCLVDWKDHSHAAFYPPLYTMMEGTRETFNITMEKAQHSFISEEIQFDSDEIWNDDKLVQYVSYYLKDPSLFVVKTEYF